MINTEQSGFGIDLMELVYTTNYKLLRNDKCWLEEIDYEDWCKMYPITSEKSGKDFGFGKDDYERIYNSGINQGRYERTNMMFNIFDDIKTILNSTPNKDVKDEIETLIEPLFQGIVEMFSEGGKNGLRTPMSKKEVK